jgi:hypothetical protein
MKNTSRVRDEPECKSAGVVDRPMQVHNPAATPHRRIIGLYYTWPGLKLKVIRERIA